MKNQLLGSVTFTIFLFMTLHSAQAGNLSIAASIAKTVDYDKSKSTINTEHLIFLDTSLPDYDILEASIGLQNTTVIFLDPNNFEGILKITEEIKKYSGLKSIHIVGHAKQAELTLGADSFWMDDLLMIQKELDSWKSHVQPYADLFLYGCSLAETEQGKEMVNLMASLTGMDVNASTNLTGPAAKNADWDLEYSTGSIESPVAFAETIKNYPHTLQSLTFSDLRTFQEVNEGSAGNWTYPDGTGRTAYQANNTGNPVYLLSAESGYLNEVFKGTITVASNAGDNDDIGFAFGFNGVNDTYIWSWDMGGINMGVRSGGAHLLYKKTSGTMSFPAVGTLIAQGSNNDPWAHGVTYQIEILYTEDRIKVNVNGITKFDVSAADAGVAQFPAGRFGFYNYSQGGVTFGNIQNAPASDAPIPPSAQDDSYGMEPNSTLNINFINGILKNDYDANLDEFTIVLVSDVSNGSLSLDTNDGSFVYTPTAGYEGTDAFTYKLVQDDNGAESSVRTVTIGIITSNQAPTDIQLTNASISEGAADDTNIGTLSTTDADIPNDQHDYSLTDNGGGRFTVIGNTLVAANSSLLTPGDYTITVRSTDLFGTSVSENFTITVVSNDKPTSADGQVVMESDDNYTFSSADFSFNDTDGDTFGGIRIETVETDGDLEYEGADVFDGTVINDISLLNFKSPANSLGDPYATFTFKVFDSRGGISTDAYTMNIEVADQVHPTAIAQNVVVQLDATGNGTTTAELVDNGSNDAYGIASLALSKTDFNCSDIATNPNTVTLTVTDNNGNVSTTTAQVTVTDALNPTVVTQDITVQLDVNGAVSITASQVNNGSTDNCAIATYNLNITDFTCDDLGENTVTLTVTDVNGNSASDTAQITVVDAIAPVLETQNVTVTLDENGVGAITTADVVLELLDNCGTPTVSVDRSNFDCANLGDYSVTITALDAGGNTTSRTATVTVTGPDNDGDFLSDACDPDDDNDGTDDNEDAFPNDPNEDTDSDGDGTGDNEDAFPNDPNEDTDSDGDGTGDNEDAFPNDPNEDTDSDGDGTGDNEDAFPNDPNEDTDSDGDGTGDNEDAFPNDPNEDTDSDGDGTGDNEDAFPNDANEDTDTDGDGTGDNEDAFPNDANEDTDTDGDGTGDNEDAFPNDANEDTDSDGDGTGDNEDAFPNDPNEDTDSDGDGTGDNEDAFPNDANEDTDTDGDGTGDNEDAFPNDANEDTDSDGDGTGDNEDAFPNDADANSDADGDGIPDAEDAFPNDADESVDTDGDGIGDNADTDDDNDGYSDEVELAEGTNAKNANEFPLDTDGDGIPNTEDDDDDNDGVLDNEDSFPLDATPTLIPAEAFTPNGDGINDTWLVPGIDNHPNNMVRVYNRWGHEVFAAQGYQNDWTGRHNANSSMLPSGSYFYVIDLGNGTPPLQGWIFINY